MVCRLLKVSVPASSPPFQSPASSVSSSGRQLRSELAQAVERTMVFTRSHDHTPATIGKESAKVDGVDFMMSAKRKSQHDADATTPTQHAAKRRRAVERLKSDITSTPQIATAVVIEVGKQDGHEMRQQEQSESEPDTRPQKVTETAAPPSIMPPRPKSRGSDTHTETPLTEPVLIDLEQEDGREKASNENHSEPGQLPGSSLAKDLKEWDKVDNAITEDGTNEEPSPKTTHEIKTTLPFPNPPESTHKRFDSAEPEPFQPQEIKQDEAPNDNPSESSNDEAPETVTASSGQAHALNASLEQSKAAAKLKKERKLKRQQRDARLKEQAKAAKKANKAAVTPKPPKPQATISEAVNTPTPTSNRQPPHKPKQPLPALLPDHILAEEPPLRPLVPLPLPTSKPFPNLKKRFLDPEQKPPKDIKKGGVRIRVLQEGNGRLPPKASQQGRAVREAWLMGRGTVQRRKMKGRCGFVRR